MKIFGITCEFNPFHTGHKYLIEQTKAKTGAEGIVCVMSGSMVQRGDVAIYDKWTRAKSAVENGADLVVELPVCYVLQSADVFAKGAVQILNAIGCDGISFGSECTDINLLYKLAEFKSHEPAEYSAALKEALDKGAGYPTACEIAAGKVLGGLPPEITSPNSTLGISYIAAANMINPNLEIHIEKRHGDYHSREVKGEFASATALRQKILSGDKISDYLLCTNDEIYDINNISALILGFFRMANAQSLSNIAGMEPGLANRLITLSKECTSYEEFASHCVTKRYTLHRIRRVILCSLLGITQAPKPTYIRVLALNSKGAGILKQLKKQGCALEVITKISNSSQRDSHMLREDILSTDIAALCAGKRASMDYTTTPIII
ncbi:MAG: nucleotidyltransferase family protein [Clostridia bacterium]|nr:nucleotidyltransferase family protein [Clostridia bacterium]